MVSISKGIDAREYLFEAWYPRLAQITFESELLAMTVSEAHALVLARERSRLAWYCREHPNAAEELERSGLSQREREVELSRSAGFAERVRLAMAVSTTDYGPADSLPDGAAAALARLTARLGEAIGRRGANGAVVKLTARSPKDALFDRPCVTDTLRSAWDFGRAELAELAKQGELNLPVPTREVVWRATMTRAAGALMRVSTAEETLGLFLNSQRVYADLCGEFALRKESCGLAALPDWDDERPFTLSLVVRQFEPRLDPLMEFRCFVTNGVLTGITQYDPYSLIPRLYRQADRARIEARLRAFLTQRVMPAMASEPAVPDYTVDVGLEAGLNTDGIWMIEVNNPPPVAGAALFGQRIDGEPWPDWSLCDGPFEFRCYSDARADSLARIWAYFDVVPPDIIGLMVEWERAIDAAKAAARQVEQPRCLVQ